MNNEGESGSSLRPPEIKRNNPENPEKPVRDLIAWARGVVQQGDEQNRDLPRVRAEISVLALMNGADGLAARQAENTKKIHGAGTRPEDKDATIRAEAVLGVLEAKKIAQAIESDTPLDMTYLDPEHPNNSLEKIVPQLSKGDADPTTLKLLELAMIDRILTTTKPKEQSNFPHIVTNNQGTLDLFSSRLLSALHLDADAILQAQSQQVRLQFSRADNGSLTYKVIPTETAASEPTPRGAASAPSTDTDPVVAEETKERKTLTLEVSEATEGKNNPNQDALLVKKEQGAFAVFDGLGGHRGGNVASDIARQSFDHNLTTFARPGEDLSDEQITTIFNNAHTDITDGQATDETLKDMKTTAVLGKTWIDNNGQAWVTAAWIGDSRLAVRRADGIYEHVTIDDTAITEGGNDAFKRMWQEATSSSRSPEELLENHEPLVRMMHDLWRKAEENLNPERPYTLQDAAADIMAQDHISPITKTLGSEAMHQPSIARAKLYPGDTVLLYTDGLYKKLTDGEIADEVQANSDSFVDAAPALIHNARDESKRTQWRGEPSTSHDDIAVIGVRATVESTVVTDALPANDGEGKDVDTARIREISYPEDGVGGVESNTDPNIQHRVVHDKITENGIDKVTTGVVVTTSSEPTNSEILIKVLDRTLANPNVDTNITTGAVVTRSTSNLIFSVDSHHMELLLIKDNQGFFLLNDSPNETRKIADAGIQLDATAVGREGSLYLSMPLDQHEQRVIVAHRKVWKDFNPEEVGDIITLINQEPDPTEAARILETKAREKGVTGSLAIAIMDLEKPANTATPKSPASPPPSTNGAAAAARTIAAAVDESSGDAPVVPPGGKGPNGNGGPGTGYAEMAFSTLSSTELEGDITTLKTQVENLQPGREKIIECPDESKKDVILATLTQLGFSPEDTRRLADSMRKYEAAGEPFAVDITRDNEGTHCVVKTATTYARDIVQLPDNYESMLLKSNPDLLHAIFQRLGMDKTYADHLMRKLQHYLADANPDNPSTALFFRRIKPMDPQSDIEPYIVIGYSPLTEGSDGKLHLAPDDQRTFVDDIVVSSNFPLFNPNSKMADLQESVAAKSTNITELSQHILSSRDFTGLYADPETWTRVLQRVANNAEPGAFLRFTVDIARSHGLDIDQTRQMFLELMEFVQDQTSTQPNTNQDTRPLQRAIRNYLGKDLDITDTAKQQIRDIITNYGQSRFIKDDFEQKGQAAADFLIPFYPKELPTRQQRSSEIVDAGKIKPLESLSQLEPTLNFIVGNETDVTITPRAITEQLQRDVANMITSNNGQIDSLGLTVNGNTLVFNGIFTIPGVGPINIINAVIPIRDRKLQQIEQLPPQLTPGNEQMPAEVRRYFQTIHNRINTLIEESTPKQGWEVESWSIDSETHLPTIHLKKKESSEANEVIDAVKGF